MSFEKDLKEQLDNLIYETYKNDSTYSQCLKWFKIKIELLEPKEKQNRYLQNEEDAIKYNSVNRTIVLHQTYKLTHPSMVVRLLHELSVYIKEKIYYGASAHGPEFWMIYEELLYSSFNLSMISPEEVLSATPIVGMNKIIQMTKRFKRSNIPEPKNNMYRVCCYNCPYSKKELMKQCGYKWNPLASQWYKVTDQYGSINEKLRKEFIDAGIKTYSYNNNKFMKLSNI